MGLIGFIVGSVCMGFYGTSADAMMHCYIFDEEINDKIPKNSGDKLKEFVDKERPVEVKH